MNATMRTTAPYPNPAPVPPDTAAPAVVSFPEGLIGIADAKRFAIETADDVEPLLRMRCLDRPELAFLLVDPRLIRADYAPRFEAEDLATIGLPAGETPLVLAIAHIAPRIEECTANLLAPLVINPSSMRGLQIILEPGSYTTRHPLVAAEP